MKLQKDSRCGQKPGNIRNCIDTITCSKTDRSNMFKSG
jgi:hypothetical protein